jgi:hypothetical protein
MPDGGKRTALTASYSWGQTGLTQFAEVFQPGHGIFSPGFPLAPPEPEKVRVWDFPVGVNTVYTPRAYEPVSFAELRALADGHDITRLAIETRKDQIERLDWTIRPRGDTRAGKHTDPRIAGLAEFWRRPDGQRPFATWLRELLEDVLVLDAPALEIRRNRAGDITGLDVVDGATIKLLVDDTGRRPLPPAPAFEQVIHGRPWKLLTSDELIYLPRNPRPHRAYGFGPVEQIVMTFGGAAAGLGQLGLILGQADGVAAAELGEAGVERRLIGERRGIAGQRILKAGALLRGELSGVIDVKADCLLQ